VSIGASSQKNRTLTQKIDRVVGVTGMIYILNSYEHKDFAHLRERPVQNLNSILRHFRLSVLNSYFKLKLTNDASVLTKDMFAQLLLTRYFVNAFEFVRE
jgi:hypothetical protein